MGTAAVRARAASRRAAGTVVDARPRPVLTGRAIVLGLTLVMLVFTLAVPARTLFGQRAEIAALQDQADSTAAQVAALRVQQQRMQDPAYVQTLIRDRLHYVLPGEVGYTVLGPTDVPAPAAASADTLPDQSWYHRLWSSVEAADGDPSVTPGGENKVSISPDAPR